MFRAPGKKLQEFKAIGVFKTIVTKHLCVRNYKGSIGKDRIETMYTSASFQARKEGVICLWRKAKLLQLFYMDI